MFCCCPKNKEKPKIVHLQGFSMHGEHCITPHLVRGCTKQVVAIIVYCWEGQVTKSTPLWHPRYFGHYIEQLNDSPFNLIYLFIYFNLYIICQKIIVPGRIFVYDSEYTCIACLHDIWTFFPQIQKLVIKISRTCHFSAIPRAMYYLKTVICYWALETLQQFPALKSFVTSLSAFKRTKIESSTLHKCY